MTWWQVLRLPSLHYRLPRILSSVSFSPGPLVYCNPLLYVLLRLLDWHDMFLLIRSDGWDWERRLSQPHTSVTEWWLTSSSLIFEEVKFGGLEFCLKLQFSTERFCNIQRITMLIRENKLLLNLISSTFYFIIWSLWGGWCVWESMNYGCWWKEIEWFSGNSRIPCVVCVIQGAVE